MTAPTATAPTWRTTDRATYTLERTLLEYDGQVCVGLVHDGVAPHLIEATDEDATSISYLFAQISPADAASISHPLSPPHLRALILNSPNIRRVCTTWGESAPVSVEVNVAASDLDEIELPSA